MYTYDRDFYRSINSGSAQSAKVIVPHICALLRATPGSVLDMGCGAGAWLAIWKEVGSEVRGVDGPYVNTEDLLIDAAEFEAHDLTHPIQLQRHFHIAQCLEVAEHLSAEAAPILVESLCRHADVVLFSAAPPGQGGENHINERPYSYWRDLFLAQEYTMLDAVRPKITSLKEVKPWYRHNCFLFIKSTALQAHYPWLMSERISEERDPPDISSGWYRLRKLIIGMLPTAMSTMIATLKKRLSNQLHRRNV